ncbi:toll/interleukin-1 receptor domain-containing protein [Thauera phenylacetica]
MSKVFVSYRRDDSAGFAGRLTDALERRFGVDSVFRDVDDIAVGADFGVVIEQALQQVQAVLVVIGPRWLDARDERGRRLDDPGDYVRREVELALASGKPVIPVLVGGATMPAAEALPPTLRGLANRNALALGDAGWGADLARLEGALAQWVEPTAPGERSAPVRGRRALAAAIVALVLALGGGWWWLRGVERGPQALVGEWSAEVAYPWNLTLREHYVFTLADGRVGGSASFLGVPRALEAEEWEDGRLRFLTRSETVSGNEPPREMGQLYEVWREGETLRVRLQIRRSHSVDAPLEFVAQRQ